MKELYVASMESMERHTDSHQFEHAYAIWVLH